MSTIPPCDIDGERWLPTPGFEAFYLVSSRGRIWSMRRRKGRLLKPWPRGSKAKTPKLAVTLHDGQTKWVVEVHVLVMRTFVGPPPEGTEIRHLDGNAYRNWWPENLAYGTHLENCRDTIRHGRQVGARGDDHGKAKLTEDIVRALRKEYAGRPIPDRALAKQFGMNRATIYKAITGKTWRHVA